MTTRASVLLLLFLAACDSTGPRDVIPAPDGVISTALTGQITVNWRDVSDRETSYQVEYSTDAVVWTLLKELPANATSVTHGGVEYQVTYFYRVRACRVSDCSEWVQTSTKWASGREPDLSKPNVSAVGTNNASLSIQIGHGGLRTFVTFYVTNEEKLVYQSASFQIDPVTAGIEVGATIRAVTPFGLNEGTRYIAFAIAQNAAGIKTSDTISFRTSKRGPPSVQFVRFFGPPSFDPATITWSITPMVMVDPGDMETVVSWEVVEANKPFSEARQVTPATGNPITNSVITSFIASVRSLLPATTYKWRLIATNAAGTAISDSVVVTTPGL